MGSHHKGKKHEVSALDAYIKLQRAAGTLNSRSARDLKQSGLTESQFGVLEMLMHLGPLQQSVIGEKLLKSGGNVTMVIDHLEQRKLLRRKVNPNDRRCIVVSLTDKGQELIQQVFPLHAARILSLMDHLTDEEQNQLGGLCRKLGLGAAGS